MAPLEPPLFDQSLDCLAHGHSGHTPARCELALARQTLTHSGRLDQVEHADTQVTCLLGAVRRAFPQRQLALAIGPGSARRTPALPSWTTIVRYPSPNRGVYRHSYQFEQPSCQTNWTNSCGSRMVVDYRRRPIDPRPRGPAAGRRLSVRVHVRVRIVEITA